MSRNRAMDWGHVIPRHPGPGPRRLSSINDLQDFKCPASCQAFRLDLRDLEAVTSAKGHARETTELGHPRDRRTFELLQTFFRLAQALWLPCGPSPSHRDPPECGRSGAGLNP